MSGRNSGDDIYVGELDKTSENNSTRSRVISALTIVAVSAVLYLYLYEYATGFVQGEFVLSLFGDQTFEALKNLILINFSFVGFSMIIASIIGLIFPNVSLSDPEIEDIINGSLLEGILVIGVLVPIEEELLFRLLPYVSISAVFFVFGTAGIWHWIAVLIVVVSTAVWVVAHGKRTPLIIPQGILYGFLLWNGLLVEGVVIHILHNCAVTIGKHYYPS